ncbi:hypothetical protein ABT186_16600 [Streptomyces sp. NPDC001634]|uniref:hypothetical protein n=1 Tax=Streptomyces sp. NPDC001634 TaxID=3154390 RepID=UPI003332A1A7
MSRISPQADLADAQARNARLAGRIQRLERRLSVALGEQVWCASAPEAPADIEELQRTITGPEQRNFDLSARVEERDGELAAARAANRELTRAQNQRP